MSKGKQGRTGISSAAGQNRLGAPENRPEILEGVLRDLEVTVGRLRVSDDLVRELSTRLLARHDQLRRLRSASDGFRGAA